MGICWRLGECCFLFYLFFFLVFSPSLQKLLTSSPRYNTDENANAIGRENPSPYNPIGPTITSVIDCREGNVNHLDGFVLEEGAIPHALTPLFQAMLDLMPGKKAPENDTIVERTQAALARYGSRFLGPYFKNGAVERTQVYLIMSHDSEYFPQDITGLCFRHS